MKTKWRWMWLLALGGCAGLDRDCSSCSASTFGSDWIVMQYRADGAPINCWKLENTAISNEERTDGIFWQDPHGHLVHISGWYNRVQVSGGGFESAAAAVGVDLKRCGNGAYAPAVKP